VNAREQPKKGRLRATVGADEIQRLIERFSLSDTKSAKFGVQKKKNKSEGF